MKERLDNISRLIIIVESMMFNGYSSVAVKNYLSDSMRTAGYTEEVIDIVLDIYGMRNTDKSDYFTVEHVKEFRIAESGINNMIPESLIENNPLKRLSDIRSMLRSLEQSGKISSTTYKIQLRLKEIQLVDYIVSVKSKEKSNKNVSEIAQEIISTFQKENLIQANTARLLRRIYKIEKSSRHKNAKAEYPAREPRQHNGQKSLSWTINLIRFGDTQAKMVGAPTEQDIKKEVFTNRNRGKLLSLRAYYNRHATTLRKIINETPYTDELPVVYDFKSNAFIKSHLTQRAIRVYTGDNYSPEFIKYATSHARTRRDAIVYIYEGKVIYDVFALYKKVVALINKYIKELNDLENLNNSKNEANIQAPKTVVRYGASITSEDVTKSKAANSSKSNQNLIAAYFKILDLCGIHNYSKPLRWPDRRDLGEAGFAEEAAKIFEALADSVSPNFNMEDAYNCPFGDELYVEKRTATNYDPCFGERISYTREKLFSNADVASRSYSISPKAQDLIDSTDTEKLRVVIRKDNSDSCRPDTYIELDNFYRDQVRLFRDI